MIALLGAWNPVLIQRETAGVDVKPLQPVPEPHEIDLHLADQWA